MALFRGIGGAGDSTTDATVTAVTTQATNAASSASAAATSATNAATSASSASTSATTATTKASEAATSASNASTSETNAATSASNASTSETNAASSASSASTSASNASTSETNAASSASAASTSETNAATSATTATTKASEASTSATNAATSESNASTSATNAATSASNASTSETNAASSATSAAASYDSFDDRYLGAKASDPTLDNDGDALVTGALYFNSTDDVMKVYDGSSWVAAYASLSGTLVATNNLSDVSSASASRTNLGLGTAATTASTDYATAAQGTLADSALQNLVEDTTPQLGGTLDTNSNNITFVDGAKAIFGTGSDLQIYHLDGAFNLDYIDSSGTGGLQVTTDGNFFLKHGTDSAIQSTVNGAVDLYYDNSKKFETTTSGATVTGTLIATDVTIGGSSVVTDADIGSTVQGYDATIVVDADIGVTVQGYDADTLKADTADTLTASFRGTVTTDNDLSFDMNATNNFKCTPSSGAALTFTNITAGQSGNIFLDNSAGVTITAAATTKINSTDLTTISTAGTYFLSYYSDGTNVLVATSQSVTA